MVKRRICNRNILLQNWRMTTPLAQPLTVNKRVIGELENVKKMRHLLIND